MFNTGREKADSNFEQLPFKVRNGADLIVIMDSGKLNTGSYGISGIARSKGTTGIIWKKGCCEKEWLLIA
ncbi:hypothetical protein [Paenibacillus polymyxa]|uniref:hypothetical protein n=1 Tax=Paenibacillus polymyxa TaxID=1406 RepID=UPI002AB53CFC|nr:hypothetical protein [Paenibacillus polymyxa]MDY8026345.1 hypothetical protein [Paenibacillus polymyxa]